MQERGSCSFVKVHVTPCARRHMMQVMVFATTFFDVVLTSLYDYTTFLISQQGFRRNTALNIQHCSVLAPRALHSIYTFFICTYGDVIHPSVHHQTAECNAWHGTAKKAEKQNHGSTLISQSPKELRKRIEIDLGEGRERVLQVAYCYYLYILMCTDDETKMIPQ